MASKMYSPSARVAELRRHINAQTPYTAHTRMYTAQYRFLSINDYINHTIGYIYYDTDMNTATSFIFEAREFNDNAVRVQKFKALFPTCIKLFRIGYYYTYYRIDAVHGK